MDALQRLIIGLAIAIAHWAAWPSAYAPPEATIACACAAASEACLCTDCACQATPDAPRSPGTPDERVPTSETQRVVTASAEVPAFAGDDTTEDAARLARTARTPTNWQGSAPFASWGVWRT